MPFKTLVERYNESVQQVYAPPTYRPPTTATSGSTATPQPENIQQRYDQTVDWLYNTQKVFFNPNDVQYNWTKLTKGNVGKNTSVLKNVEGRSLPVLSAIDDVKRLAQFQASGKGLLFLAKEALLQTGNTFGITRVVNPAFIVGNAAPFFHFRRQLLPVTVLGQDGGPSKALVGKLQAETIKNLGGFLTNDNNYRGVNKNGAVRMTSNFFSKDIFKKLKSPVSAVRDAVKLSTGATKSDGLAQLYLTSTFPLTYGNRDNTFTLRTGAYKGIENSLEKQYGYTGDFTGEHNMFFGGGIRSLQKIDLNSSDNSDLTEYDEQLQNGNTAAILDALHYGTKLNAFKEPEPFIRRNTNNLGPGEIGVSRRPNNTLPPNEKLKDVYKALADNSNRDDYVITRFKVGEYDVQFRSFIRDIKETVNSQFTEKDYIGRTERFVTYTGAKRDLSFTLQLIAMSQDELLATHSRLNFLIGSLFPVNAMHGLLQPPIAYLTIGDLFNRQPGYFKSLNIDYPYSWEIRGEGKGDRAQYEYQLPMGANISVNFAILEKGTVFHRSPFHAVMEKF
jgi:hypothetical protein